MLAVDDFRPRLCVLRYQSGGSKEKGLVRLVLAEVVKSIEALAGLFFFPGVRALLRRDLIIKAGSEGLGEGVFGTGDFRDRGILRTVLNQGES